MTTPKTYRFTLPEPPSANRWHRNVAGVVVKSREARQYQEAAYNLALAQGVRQIRRPATVAVTIAWYRGRKAGDLDKRLGVALDALQGAAFENDSQIIHLVASRHEAEKGKARLEVTVTELTATGAAA